MSTRTLTVPFYKLDEFKKAYRRIVRAAIKLGVDASESGLTVLFDTKREREKTVVNTMVFEGEETSTTRLVATQVVDVTVEIPDTGSKSGKWKVAALVTAVEDGKNDIFPSEPELVSAYSEAKISCHHCGVNRYRVKGVVCREVATGKLVQLGAECAKHYVDDPTGEISAMDFQELVFNTFFINDDDEIWGEREGGTSGVPAFDLDEAMAVCAMIVRRSGSYVKSRLSYEEDPNCRPNMDATWRMAATVLLKEPGANLEWNVVTDEDREHAEKVIKWVRSADATDNEFLTELTGLFQNDWVSERRLPLACAALPCFTNSARKAEEQANPPVDPAPVGRVVVTGEILSMKTVDKGFGPSEKMIVRLTCRNKVWMTVPGSMTADVGDVITVKATFKHAPGDSHFAFGSRPIEIKPKALEPVLA